MNQKHCKTPAQEIILISGIKLAHFKKGVSREVIGYTENAFAFLKIGADIFYNERKEYTLILDSESCKTIETPNKEHTIVIDPDKTTPQGVYTHYVGSFGEALQLLGKQRSAFIFISDIKILKKALLPGKATQVIFVQVDYLEKERTLETIRASVLGKQLFSDTCKILGQNIRLHERVNYIPIKKSKK